MASASIKASPSSILISMAAFVVVVAGMRASADIVVPFLLAVFIAIISAPTLDWLERLGLSRIVSMVVVLAVLVAAGVLITGLVGSSLGRFSAELPEYTARLNAYSEAVERWLNGHGIPFDAKEMRGFVDASQAMRLAAEMFNSFGSVLANAFLIFLTVVFILFETASFAVKVRAVARDPDDALAQLKSVGDSVKRYVAMKTLTSLATGVVIGISLAILGVDNAVLWGLLAFMLNYVPNIGSIIAAVPAVLFALVQLGVGGAVATAIVFLVVNVVVGSVVEPRIMGRGLGLSTLVVFLSLVLWGWVLGPVGMFLSVPLTMTVKIALDAYESTRWIAVFLGSGQNVETTASTKSDPGTNAIES